ncbi:hypothetical protein O6H91_11G061500 [Diphasiastrum complanatum]|uniref:Uncharacterized protein n=3 Tax=Diphasiastrum complanatum TaxID=34168 RepID=A0ACC2CA28_DIPCM|nr:hypothetical protein O6H91_11G061500 [Diphasiastrum complanatum]KAJ7538731.1 hypothetical protein O6H91_11G061500 [Diphasiastrum complanatum]KAJ7538733.1 hypothetical protein O6H91_11G061500 [Diphasiastrum complanatum]
MAEESEDYVVYGTPLEREEELAPRKRAAALEKGQARRQPIWKQEATDSEGRRRFHGAFSGGFSAGYFNTVGSKEGWQPQTFMSSRQKRAEHREQSAHDFMDEDEKEEVEGKDIGSTLDFDTFGSTAAEYARKRALQEALKRPGAIPGPIPDEIVVPVANSIGVKLLSKMGWRHGRAIGPSHLAASTDALRLARKAMLATANSEEKQGMKQRVYGAELPPGLKSTGLNEDCADVQGIAKQYEENDDIEVPSSTPIFVLHPKNDLHGLGFDPFKNAPEFREKKRARLGLDDRKASRAKLGDFAGKPSLFRPNAGRTGGGFGIGTLEELGDEDEDVYTSIDVDEKLAEEEEMMSAENLRPSQIMPPPSRKDGVLPGFKLATVPSFKEERFPPPIVPRDFVPSHKFPHTFDSKRFFSELAPPEALPPDDTEMCKIIEGLAVFVARSGKLFEDLSKEKNREDPRFLFLFGGPGAEYYKRRLWEEQKNLAEQGKAPLQKEAECKPKSLDASKRGQLLGESPLHREQIAMANPLPSGESSNRQGTMELNMSGVEIWKMFAGSQPFRSDTAKQARFEQYLKDKYLGGLRTLDVGLAKQLTELQRAQEVLEFENVCHGLQKDSLSLNASNGSQQYVPELARVMGNRFTSGGTENLSFVSITQETSLSRPSVVMPDPQRPKRQEQPWRPESLLCKRFNLLDPFPGKPRLPKTSVQRENAALDEISELSTISKANLGFMSVENSSAPGLPGTKGAISETVAAPLALPVEEEQSVTELLREKPVDLYKAIFSDDSDEEVGDDDSTQTTTNLPSTMQGAEAANAALNRLVADDFLESLGMELGLRVPPLQRTGLGWDQRGASEGEKSSKEGVPYQEAKESFGKEETKIFKRQAAEETTIQQHSEGLVSTRGIVAPKQQTSELNKGSISSRKAEVLKYSKHDREKEKGHEFMASKDMHKDDCESSGSEQEHGNDRYNSHRARKDSRRAKEEKRSVSSKAMHRGDYDSNDSEQEQGGDRYASQRAPHESRRAKEEKHKHRHRKDRSRKDHKTQSSKQDKYKEKHDRHHWHHHR